MHKYIKILTMVSVIKNDEKRFSMSVAIFWIYA